MVRKPEDWGGYNWRLQNRSFRMDMSRPKTAREERVVGEWVVSAGRVPQQQGESGHAELLRGTQRYFVEGEAQDKQPSGRRMGKLKVAVYGEGALADSGNGLKQGKGSIQGPAFPPMQHISSLHILLMEPLAAPFQNKFH